MNSSSIPLPNQAHMRKPRIMPHAHMNDRELAVKCKNWADQALYLHKEGLSHSVSSLCAMINGAAVSSDNCKRSAIRARPACNATTKIAPTRIDAKPTKTKRVEDAEAKLKKLQKNILDDVTKFQEQLDGWQNITQQERVARRELIAASAMLGESAEI